MSRNGTMGSGVSNSAFQQQQQSNLLHLHQLEQNYNNYQQSKSLTSSDRRMANEAVQAQQTPNLSQPQGQALTQASVQPHNNSLSSKTQQRNLSVFQDNQPIPASDPRSPFSVTVPTNSNPTEVLAGRFAAWRGIITSLLQYLTEIVSIQDEVVRQQIRLSHAVNFPQLNQDPTKRQTNNQPNPNQPHNNEIFQSNFFLSQGNGSIQDLPNVLINFHGTSANLASKTSKELSTTVIPRLDDLRRELLIKIKEIKGLSSDFKNSVNKELAQTKADLQTYLKSIEDAKYHHTAIQPKNDPYLTRIILDKQIKKQLLEENYLHEAYINLQSSGKELEKVVVIEIQNALTVFAKLLGEQAQNVFDKLISNLDYGFLTKQPTFEWDQFIAKDKNFIDENLPKRDYKLILYDKINDPFTFEIRSSFLERRSKFLKSYSRGYYVLTSTFFHEFKSADRKKDLIPVMSLPLDDIELEEYSKKDSNQNKFVLKKVGKLSSHKFIFRADNYELMLSWYNDIKNLKKISAPLQRANYASKNHVQKKTNDQLSRISTNNSKVVRNQSIYDSTHETDTILSLPSNNQSLPQSSSSPIPQSMVNSNGIFVKQVDVSSQTTPQNQQNQRFSLPYPTSPVPGLALNGSTINEGNQIRRSLDSQRGISNHISNNNVIGTGINVGDGTEDTIKSAKKETYTDDAQA